MANILRLITALLLCIPVLAHSAAPQQKWNISIGPNNGYIFSSAGAACSAYAALYATDNTSGDTSASVKICDPSNYSFYVTLTAFNQTGEHTRGQYFGGYGKYYCADNPGVDVAYNYVCAEPPCTTDIITEGGWSAGALKTMPKSGCLNTCGWVYNGTPSPVISCAFGGGLGTCEYVFDGQVKYTGDHCQAGDAPTPPDAPPPQDPCPQCRCFEAGGSYGMVNGVGTCVPQGTPGTPPVTTTPPPTTTTTTPAATPENPNPAPTTTTNPAPTTTINPPPAGAPPGTQPTVTTTQQNPDGTTTSTTSGLGQYCEQHPNTTQCGGGKGSFGGTCEGTFQCDGDAVSCAIAVEQHKRNCEFYKSDNELKQEGEKLRTQAEKDMNPAHEAHREKVDVQTHLEVTSATAAVCIVDKQFTVNGHSFNLPISNMCPYLEALGYLFLALSYMGAAKILAGAVS